MGVMTAIAVGGAVVGAAGGITKMIKGGKAKRDAKRALRKYKRQTFKNVNDGRRISTRGAELAREESARNTATNLENLRSGGIRGSVGGTGQVQESANRLNQQIGVNLDEQQVQLDREIAMDDARIRQLQEQRDNANINNMQAQLNAGEQTQMSGLGDIAQSAFAAARAMDEASGDGDGDGAGAGANTAVANPMEGYNPSLGAANAKARTAFGDIGGAFGNNPINPITGLPYNIPQ